MSRVLVVADDPWVVSEVHAALSIGTNELIDHGDPSTAAVATGDESVDVAVVDLQVASMGGMAITRSIRDLESPVPVVLLLDREADTFLAGRSGGVKLHSRLSPLYSWAHDGDGAPTAPVREIYGHVEKELGELAAEWTAILETDLPALNAKARSLDLDFAPTP